MIYLIAAINMIHLRGNTPNQIMHFKSKKYSEDSVERSLFPKKLFQAIQSWKIYIHLRMHGVQPVAAAIID